MKNKSFLLVIVLLVLVLALSACTRSASTAPAGAITATSELPFEFKTPGSLSTEIVSQTAAAGGYPDQPKSPTEQAGGGVPGDLQPTALPLPAETTAAPEVVQPTQAPIANWQPTPGLPASYTLNKGEFPYCIARRFNINPSEMLAANGLTTNSVVNPGSTLKIPSGASGWPGQRARISHPASYTVREGDTIYSIACAYGDVDPNGIIAANNLQSPYTLTSGQTLSIP